MYFCGSKTPVVPLSTIMNWCTFQVATGWLRRKIDQCLEININIVTVVSINSGITHMLNLEQHDPGLKYAHPKSDTFSVKCTEKSARREDEHHHLPPPPPSPHPPLSPSSPPLPTPQLFSLKWSLLLYHLLNLSPWLTDLFLNELFSFFSFFFWRGGVEGRGYHHADSHINRKI